MFTPEQMAVIKFCAEECIRQGKRDPMSTYDMVSAWDHAYFYNFAATEFDGQPKRITIDFIKHIGMLVEPEENIEGFRNHKIGITDVNAPFGVRDIGSDWREIPRHLQALIDSYYEGTLISGGHAETKGFSTRSADEFYFHFEGIHPFGDGNGRTGKVLYNYLRGTMENPQMPPNFWGISNP